MMLWSALTTGLAMGHTVEMAAGKLEFHQVFLMGRFWLIGTVWAFVQRDRSAPDSGPMSAYVGYRTLRFRTTLNCGRGVDRCEMPKLTPTGSGITQLPLPYEDEVAAVVSGLGSAPARRRAQRPGPTKPVCGRGPRHRGDQECDRMRRALGKRMVGALST
jgi:hypothetical protein